MQEDKISAQPSHLRFYPFDSLNDVGFDRFDRIG